MTRFRIRPRSVPIVATPVAYYQDHAVWQVEYRDFGSALLVGFVDRTLASDEEHGLYPATNIAELRVNALGAMIDADWWMTIRRGVEARLFRDDSYEFVSLGSNWAAGYRAEVLDYEEVSEGSLDDGVFAFAAPREVPNEILDKATSSLRSFWAAMDTSEPLSSSLRISALAVDALNEFPVALRDFEGQVSVLTAQFDWAEAKSRLEAVAEAHGLVLPPSDRLIC